MEMEPSLGAVFPMTVEGDSIITTKSVLLNKTVVLPQGTILRCCFQMPEKDSADLKKKQKKNSIEQTFSRKPIKVSNKQEDYDPYREAIKDRAFQTVWNNPDLFRGYFYKVDPARYYLVYQLPGSPVPAFAQFFFPEGLFLVSDGTHIEVLSIEPASRSDAAGFQVGDRIHVLEGLELKGDLKRFLSHYLTSLKQNKLKGQPLQFSVSPAESTEKRVIREIRLPLSIHADPFGPIGE